MPSVRRTLLGCLGVPLIFVTAAFLFLYYFCGAPGGPWFERESSPDGRYEVVRETRSFFLDGYAKLWITTRGEQDPKQWFLIAPEVDGTWSTDWMGPRELMLTNYGGPRGDEPHKVVTWRDIRIEQRPAPSCAMMDSPDQLHCLDVWTYEDSHGRRSSARLRSTWKNQESGSLDLVSQGHWRIDATWLANDRLRIIRSKPADIRAVYEELP